MTVETIDREAGDSGKGFRLQLIRAIHLILDTINKDQNTIFFTAIENREDVSHQIISNGDVTNYYEEDKNYDLSSNFTIFSSSVTNTLVSFFDIYIEQFRASSSVYLGFYTTRNIGKERKTKLHDGTDISLPSESILEIIQSVDKLSDDIILIIKKF